MSIYMVVICPNSLDCTIYMLGVFASKVSQLIGTCICSLFKTRHNRGEGTLFPQCSTMGLSLISVTPQLLGEDLLVKLSRCGGLYNPTRLSCDRQPPWTLQTSAYAQRWSWYSCNRIFRPLPHPQTLAYSHWRVLLFLIFLSAFIFKIKIFLYFNLVLIS